MSTHRISSQHSFAPINPDPLPPILLGDSVAIRTLRAQVQRIAPYFRTALLRGEHGTGKQRIARALHALSPASGGPFIVSTALALADDASPARASVLGSARNGTLYLDAIGELLPVQQSALLRVLDAMEDRRTAPAGLPRIVAATHRDLGTLASIGQFRPDLYSRLSAVELTAPPMRERSEDIPHLAAWLLRRLAERTGTPPKLLEAATLAHLQHLPLPNNLADLKRTLTHAAARAEDDLIEPRHLLTLTAPAPARPTPRIPPIERLHDVIHRHVVDVLMRCGGNKLRAAELLGISRSTLYRMLDAATPLVE